MKKALDWQAVRQRLANAIAVAEGATDVGDEQNVLDERARRLARPLVSNTPSGDARALVTFAIGSERYAIEAALVREVARLTDYTPVPGATMFVGVTNLRGQILPLVNFRVFLELPSVGVTDLSWLIVLGNGRNDVGILTDHVDDVLLLRDAEMGPLPAGSTELHHVRGVTKDALVVIDGDAFLRDRRLFMDGGSGQQDKERG